jgi:hypothetical protein
MAGPLEAPFHPSTRAFSYSDISAHQGGGKRKIKIVVPIKA